MRVNYNENPVATIIQIRGLKVGFLSKFGPAFEKLSQHDKMAVITTVAEAVRNTDRYVPPDMIPQFVHRIASTPEELDCARDWYRRWQEAGNEAHYLLQALQEKPRGLLGKG